MKSMLRFISLGLFVVVFLSAAGGVFAQSYPTKPIKWIVGYSAGGATDITARTVGNKLAERLGQPVLVENRPGANSNIGTEAASRAAPDGYTLFSGTVSNTINYSLFSNLPFDFLKDFDPVTQVASVVSTCVVHPSLPVKSVKELIELAKSKPGALNYGSSGIGGSPHLAAEMLKMMAGVDLVHVPYKGDSPCRTDLLAGRVQVSFLSIPSLVPHIKAGRLRLLAVNGPERTPIFPDVPTMQESGFPGFLVTSWNGVVVPAGTPKEIISRLNSELEEILKMPEVRERLSTLGADPVGSTPEEFGAFIKAEIEKWAKVIKATGAKVE